MVVALVWICNTAVAVPLGPIETLDGLTVAVGAPAICGRTDPVREIVPLNCPMLLMVMLTVPVEPRDMVRNCGLVVMLKSGAGALVIISVMVAWWEMDPLLAVKTIE